jgi:hypothetical protein
VAAFHLEGFRQWLERTADPPCKFVPSWVSGFLLTAGGRSITTDSIDQALVLAQESGMGPEQLVAMRTLGGWMMRYQEAEILGELDAPAPKPAARAQSAAIAEGSGQYELEADIEISEGSPAKAPIASRRKLVAVGVTGLVLAGCAAAFFLVSSEPPKVVAVTPKKPTPAPKPAPVIKTPSPTIPTGWQTGSGPAPSLPILYRGASADDPDHGIYFEEVPSKKESIGVVAKRIEQALADKIKATGGTYESSGCGVLTLGQVTFGLCQALVNQAGRSFSLRAYVHIKEEKATLALSMAKSSLTESAADADQAVAAMVH